MDRAFVSAGSTALSPDCSRIVEAICLRLFERHPTSLSASAERTRQKSRHQLMVADYRQLRCRLFYSGETLQGAGCTPAAVSNQSDDAAALIRGDKTAPYINDLPEAVRADCVMFTDDVNLYRRVASYDDTAFFPS